MLNALQRARGLLAGKDALIFDFDGTVADTTPLHARAFQETLAPLGIKVDYASIAGMKTLDAMRTCIRASGRDAAALDLSALVAGKQARARALIASDLEPIEGVEGFLRWARGRYKLAMATSGSRETVTLALKKLGIQGFFDPLVCAEDVQAAKPAPDIFLKALAGLDVAPHLALVFEDADSGLAAATAAGLDCIDVRAEGWSWSALTGVDDV